MKTMNAVAVLFVMMLAVGANAEKPYGPAGCGLGSMIFGTKGGLSKQIMAHTTNGSSGTQTFGITSGTSNCVDSGVVKRTKEAQMFIEVNKEAVAKDISRGNGETVKSLSRLFQCDSSIRLGGVLQKQYGAIFPSEGTNADQVTGNIISVIHSEKDLAKSCRI